MFVPQNCNLVVHYFRPNRKRFSLIGSLAFLIILLLCTAQQTDARPNQDEDLSRHFDAGDELKNVNNLEAHEVKVVDDVLKEDHPIIIYKEDFVSDDYVLPKNEKQKRRYKDIAHRRRHNTQNLTDVVIEEKPDKILFDILPEKPIVVMDDMEKSGKSYMNLVPLINNSSEVNVTDKDESNLKEELQKRPKKYHRRVRRSTNGDHIVYKRNPYFRHIPKIVGEVPAQVQYIYVKHSVAGKKHNGLDIPVSVPRPSPTEGPNDNVPMSIGNRIAADENDRVIFSGGSATTRTTQRPAETIFRDPRPENFDFSFMNSQRPAAATSRPIFTRRPETTRQEESIFRDPRPENFDFSFMNPQQQQSSFAPARVPAPASRPEPATQAGISQCVWAIVNCCSSRNSEIRYGCFEQNGCYGAFWGLNPCADNVKDNFINFVADYYA